MTGYRCVKEVSHSKWDPKKLKNSQLSVELLKYSDEKTIPTASMPFLSKCCAVVSSRLESPRLCLMHIAPTRQLKGFTSDEVRMIFHKKFWKYLGSDFTINSLEEDADIIRKGICYFINDGTTLFASKAKRTRDRLVGGFSELVSDGKYIYQDALGGFKLEGPVTFIMNMTSESYSKHKDRMLGLTFLERTLTIHHVLSKKELEDWVKKEDRARNVTFNNIIRLRDIETDLKEIPSRFLKLIKIRAWEFSHLSVRSYVGSQDIMKAFVRAHAALNNRKYVCLDDFYVLSLLKQYLIDPFNPSESMIIRLRAKGIGYGEICQKIGWPTTCRQQVKRIIKRAEMRGILQT